jgi:uncharacterized membrane protein
MGEIFLFLVGLAFVLALLFVIFAMPIIAFVRSRHVAKLSARLEELAQEVARLRQVVGTQGDTGPAAAPSVGEPVQHEASIAARASAAPRRIGRGLLFRPPDAVSLEEWIGRRGLGWVAVVLLLLATAFFLKHAFENQWIGELGRVGIGIVAGAGLCVVGWRSHRRGYRVFSQMLTAGGVVLIYLATFAAFGYYDLLPQHRAAVFLIILVAEAAALAVLYDAPAIALMAVIGGLLNPVLLQTDHDRYRALFSYLVMLDLGVVALALFRTWRVVATVALVGTQLLYWGWWFAHYHPEKLVPALVFQAAVFGIFLLHNVVAHVVRQKRADVEALARTVLNAFAFAVACYVLLDEDYHVWMGTAAVGMAIIYAALAWLILRRRPDDPWQQLVVVATGLAFVATAFPLQAEAAWIALGWAVEGAGLSWFGLRIRSDRLRGLGAALLALGVGRLLLVDTASLTRTEAFVPVFNMYALPALSVAACVLLAAVASRRFVEEPRGIDHVARISAGLVGVLLVWMVLSLDTYQYFTARITPLTPNPTHVERIARTSLSVLWPAYGGLLLAVGFKLDSAPLRWTGLMLFALTLGKVVLVDMAELPGFYRIAAFFVSSIIMGVAAWGYQRFERMRNAKATEGRHEMA